MATKPSAVGTWATLGGTRAVPTPPEIASGWADGQSPPAPIVNYLLGLAGDWSAYLSDGALTGNHTITGTLGVSGLLTASGGLQVPTGQTLDVNGVADLAGATGLKLPSRTIQLDICGGKAIIGAGNVVAGFTASSTPTGYVIPIHLHAGDQITGIRVYYERNSGNSIGFSLVQIACATDVASNLVEKIISSGTGAANTDLQTSPSNGSLPRTLAAGNTYRFRADLANTDKLIGVEITYGRP